jgi:flagellar basal body-associated protein FliL
MAEEKAVRAAALPGASPQSGLLALAVNGAGIFVLTLIAVVAGGFINAALHPAPEEYVLDAKDNHIRVFVPSQPFRSQAEALKFADKKKPAGPALFYSLDPPLVVNFEEASTVRFLQIGVDVMARDPAVIDAVQRHSPLIRNNLLLMISNRDYKKLMTREGKEELRTEALSEVRQILKRETGTAGVEDLLFNSFVVQ